MSSTIHVSFDMEGTWCEVEDQVIEAVAENVYAKLEESVSRTVQEAVEAGVAERLTPILDDIFAEGFATYSQYDGPTGKRVTVKEFVAENMRWKPEASFDSDQTAVQRLTAKLLSNAINKELKPLISEAKKRLSNLIDAKIGDELVQVVRNRMRGS